MTEARLKSGLWVRGLMRLAQNQGYDAMRLRKGDEDAGAVLLVLRDRQDALAVLRETAVDAGWERMTFEGQEALDTYLERQIRYDPDLWILEITLDDLATPVEKTFPPRSL